MAILSQLEDQNQRAEIPEAKRDAILRHQDNL
jgi:hypothetical protein